MKVAKAASLILCLSLFPTQSAHAAVTFGSQTTVNTNGLSSLSYTGIQGSLDGSILVASANGALIRSIDSGTTWSVISSAGNKNWSAIAVNDSGTVIAAAESSGGVWLSTNSGSSFVLQSNGVPTSSNWYWLDMNSTGTIIAASNSGSSVYISTNTGSSWAPQAVTGASQIKSIAMSAAGDKMAVLSQGNNTLYTSTNTGVSWTPQTRAGVIAQSAPGFLLSKDGQRIVFMRNDGSYLSRTTDFGATWETLTAGTSYAIAMTASDDGTTIWLGGNGGNSYYSSNSGSNWASSVNTGSWKMLYINPSGLRWVALISTAGIWTSEGVPSAVTYRSINAGMSNWGKTSMSNDGSVVVASSIGGEVVTSRDGGNTWLSITSLGRNNSWNCLAVSGDGNVIYAGGYSSRLYKSTDKGLTFSALSGTNLPTTSSSIYGCNTNTDGLKLGIAISGGIYFSSNGAGSLTLLKNKTTSCTGSYEFMGVAMTNDGKKFATACSSPNSYLLTSSDFGVTWETTTLTSTSLFRDIKCSPDGSVLIATFYATTTPKISRNWGAQFDSITSAGANFSYGLSINSDGSLIVLSGNQTTSTPYYSINRGETFTQISGMATGAYSSIAISGDATNMLVGMDGKFLTIQTVSVTFSYASFSSLAASGAPAFRTIVRLTATLANAGTDGKVTFTANGKPIPGCTKVASNALIAVCDWKPASRGAVTLGAVSFPTNSSYKSASIAQNLSVTARTGYR
jgi:photosystem II stability/assembly factor-like uncharacterized protein